MKTSSNKRIWVTPTQLAAHEFLTTLRQMLKSDFDQKEILTNLHKQRESAIKALTSTLGLCLLTFLAAPDGIGATGFEISTPYFSISIPKLYIVFATSIFWGFGIFAIISSSLINAYILVINKRIGGAAPWHMVSRPFDSGGAFIDPFLVSWRFFSTGALQSFIQKLSMLILLLPFGLFAFVILHSSLKFLISVLLTEHGVKFENLLAFSSLLLFVFPTIYIVIISVPFPVYKNPTYIRWVFLSRIYNRAGMKHPEISTWIGE